MRENVTGSSSTRTQRRFCKTQRDGWMCDTDDHRLCCVRLHQSLYGYGMALLRSAYFARRGSLGTNQSCSWQVMDQITEALYEQTMDAQEGVVYFLLDQMADQHIKEAAVAYFVLLASGAWPCTPRASRKPEPAPCPLFSWPLQGSWFICAFWLQCQDLLMCYDNLCGGAGKSMSHNDLDEACEAYLERTFGERVDFAIERSLPELLQDGMVNDHEVGPAHPCPRQCACSGNHTLQLSLPIKPPNSASLTNASLRPAAPAQHPRRCASQLCVGRGCCQLSPWTRHTTC